MSDYILSKEMNVIQLKISNNVLKKKCIIISIDAQALLSNISIHFLSVYARILARNVRIIYLSDLYCPMPLLHVWVTLRYPVLPQLSPGYLCTLLTS